MALKMEHLIGIGVLLMIIGLIIVFFGIFMSAKETGKAKVAVGGFIGPIPFGFGNDKTLLWFVTILSLVVFLFWLFLNFRFFKGT